MAEKPLFSVFGGFFKSTFFSLTQMTESGVVNFGNKENKSFKEKNL